MRCPARPACPSSPTTGSQGGRWSGPKLEPPKPTAVPADGKRSPWSLCTLAYRAFPARSASPTPAHHVRGIGDTASRCRIGHLPFPVHSRRLRWTLSGLRRGRAAYLTGLTTMTSCFSRGLRRAVGRNLAGQRSCSLMRKSMHAGRNPDMDDLPRGRPTRGACWRARSLL